MQCHMKYIDNISRLFIINKLYVEIFQIKKKIIDKKITYPKYLN